MADQGAYPADAVLDLATARKALLTQWQKDSRYCDETDPFALNLKQARKLVTQVVLAQIQADGSSVTEMTDTDLAAMVTDAFIPMETSADFPPVVEGLDDAIVQRVECVVKAFVAPVRATVTAIDTTGINVLHGKVTVAFDPPVKGVVAENLAYMLIPPKPLTVVRRGDDSDFAAGACEETLQASLPVCLHSDDDSLDGSSLVSSVSYRLELNVEHDGVMTVLRSIKPGQGISFAGGWYHLLGHVVSYQIAKLAGIARDKRRIESVGAGHKPEDLSDNQEWQAIKAAYERSDAALLPESNVARLNQCSSWIDRVGKGAGDLISGSVARALRGPASVCKEGLATISAELSMGVGLLPTVKPAPSLETRSLSRDGALVKKTIDSTLLLEANGTMLYLSREAYPAHASQLTQACFTAINAAKAAGKVGAYFEALMQWAVHKSIWESGRYAKPFQCDLLSIAALGGELGCQILAFMLDRIALFPHGHEAFPGNGFVKSIERGGANQEGSALAPGLFASKREEDKPSNAEKRSLQQKQRALLLDADQCEGATLRLRLIEYLQGDSDRFIDAAKYQGQDIDSLSVEDLIRQVNLTTLVVGQHRALLLVMLRYVAHVGSVPFDDVYEAKMMNPCVSPVKNDDDRFALERTAEQSLTKDRQLPFNGGLEGMLCTQGCFHEGDCDLPGVKLEQQEQPAWFGAIIHGFIPQVVDFTGVVSGGLPPGLASSDAELPPLSDFLRQACYYGVTPLMLASRFGHMDIVLAIVVLLGDDFISEIQKCDGDGTTVLGALEGYVKNTLKKADAQEKNRQLWLDFYEHMLKNHPDGQYVFADYPSLVDHWVTIRLQMFLNAPSSGDSAAEVKAVCSTEDTRGAALAGPTAGTKTALDASVPPGDICSLFDALFVQKKPVYQSKSQGGIWSLVASSTAQDTHVDNSFRALALVLQQLCASVPESASRLFQTWLIEQSEHLPNEAQDLLLPACPWHSLNAIEHWRLLGQLNWIFNWTKAHDGETNPLVRSRFDAVLRSISDFSVWIKATNADPKRDDLSIQWIPDWINACLANREAHVNAFLLLPCDLFSGEFDGNLAPVHQHLQFIFCGLGPEQFPYLIDLIGTDSQLSGKLVHVLQVLLGALNGAEATFSGMLAACPQVKPVSASGKPAQKRGLVINAASALWRKASPKGGSGRSSPLGPQALIEQVQLVIGQLNFHLQTLPKTENGSVKPC